MSDLPDGWAKAKITDVAEVIRGITFPASAKETVSSSDNVCCLRTSNIQEQIAWGDVYYVSRSYVKRGDQFVTAGDILMSMANSYELVGKVACAEVVEQTTAFGAFLAAIRPRDAVTNRYLLHLLRSSEIQAGLRSGSSQTTNIANISIGTLGSVEAPVAPIPEQKRIADKLDALLDRIDTCRDRLDRVPKIIKQFRQSVLSAAVSGRLTKECRKDDSSSEIGTLPPTWSVTQVKEVGRVQLGRQRAPKYHDGANMRPYLRVQNIFEDRLDLSDVMEMEFSEADFERFRLHHGDILLCEGQSPEFLGRPAMFRNELPDICFTNTLIRFQAYPAVRPDYALLVFRHFMHAGRFRSEGTITTNIAHLGAGRFANVEFPLPPLDEQDVIVRRVESLFALADRLEARVNTARARVDTLTSATLAKAFRGELVPQDPNDEPASVLLERIRAQRASTPPTSRQRRKSSN